MDPVMDPLLARLGLPAISSGQIVMVAALAAARVVPLFTLAPFFGGRLVPQTLRIGFTLAFVVLILPVVAHGAPSLAALSPLELAALLAKEALVGTILGFLAAVPFWAADSAGRLADAARGAGQGESLVPQTGTTSSPLGNLFLQLALLVFFAVDGHLLFLRALAASYQAIPVAKLPAGLSSAALGSLAVDATAQLILAAIGLAAPVLAAVVVADVVLGLVGRVSPQLQLYFIGLPVKAVLGILVLALTIGGIVTAMRGELGTASTVLQRALRVLP
jgi:type III secretion protein SpaR/YscT/HrcT